MEKKNSNLIYIVAIDHSSSTNKCSDYAQYCLKTWEYWCKKHDIDLIVCTEHDNKLGRPIWNKEKIFSIGKQYEKIGVVDSDTMVRWDTPNIFNTFNDEWCGVVDNADLGWILDSIKNYNKFYPNIKLNIDNYFNAGVLFFHNKYLNIFENLLNLYLNNQEELDNWDKGGGKEQTLLNYTAVKNKINFKPLNPEWNLFAMHKKDMFHHNWQLKTQTNHFLKYGYIWHFTGFPVEQRKNLMKQTWDLIKSKYE